MHTLIEIVPQRTTEQAPNATVTMPAIVRMDTGTAYIFTDGNYYRYSGVTCNPGQEPVEVVQAAIRHLQAGGF